MLSIEGVVDGKDIAEDKNVNASDEDEKDDGDYDTPINDEGALCDKENFLNDEQLLQTKKDMELINNMMKGVDC